MTRMVCQVPGCHRSAPSGPLVARWGSGAAWVCQRHWSAVPRALRGRYTKAKRLSRRRSSPVTERTVRAIFARCVNAAILEAMGIGAGS